MASLTLDVGQRIDVTSADVLRIRRYIPILDHSEPDGTPSHRPMSGRNSRVDWTELDFVQEQPADAAMLVTKENDKIVQFTMLDDNPIWLNAGAAAGPYHGAKFDLPPKANAAVLIGNKVQYVKETPQQVASIIKAKGGKVLPTDRTMFETAVKEVEAWVREPEIWDADLYQTGAPGT